MEVEEVVDIKAQKSCTITHDCGQNFTITFISPVPSFHQYLHFTGTFKCFI